jgi:hypothetical protein
MEGKHVFDYQGTLKDFRKIVPKYMVDLRDDTPMYACRFCGGILPAEDEKMLRFVSVSVCKCPNAGRSFSAEELKEGKANCLGRSRHEGSIEARFRDSGIPLSGCSRTEGRASSSNWKDALGKRKWRVLTPGMPPKDITGGD